MLLKRLVLLAVVLALVAPATWALSQEEQNGILAMIKALPGISSPFGTSRWNASDVKNACNWRSIQCEDGSITSMYAWLFFQNLPE